jgi:phosphoribosylanthranilate isomerase
VIRVKICGINHPAAFDAATAADWIGFVFYPRSPRYITAETAAALSARKPGGPQRVGLFVEPSDDEITAVLARVSLDVLQIYAKPGRVADLTARFAMPVWRAVPVQTGPDLPSSAGAAAALLIEPRPPADAARPGGNAQLLDWSLLTGWRAPCPWLLAGGLRPDNVARAIAQSGARAVDVSSGVEDAPGRKSPALITEFIAAANTAATPSAPS